MGNVSIKFEPRNSLFDFINETSKISLIRRVKGFPAAKNMAIRGENLAALAALKAGAGISGESVNVDIIYIDPPYNVGGDQGYQNKWKGVSEKERHWAGDHGKFLDFMEPRLKIGRSLLKDEGVIFVSICDGEYCRLKILMDEIFGESNSIGTIIWDKSQGSSSDHITVIHEYVLVYAKNKASAYPLLKEKPAAQMMIDKAIELKKSGASYKEAQKEFKKWVKQMEKEKLISSGESPYNLLHPVTFRPFQPTPSCAQDKPEKRYKEPLVHPVTKKKCPVPSKGWKWKKETLVDMARYSKNEIVIGDGFVIAGRIKYGVNESSIPRKVQYLDEKMFQTFPTVIKESYGGDKDLPNGVRFSTPKPVNFVKELIRSIKKDDAIVLDYFAGSGATAHAVDRLNKEDGGTRRWIMIEEMNSTFNMVQLKRFEAFFPGTYCTYELQSATIQDKELMKVFSQYSKDFIASYHFLNTDIAQSEQGMTVVGHDESAKCIVAITNPTDRKNGRIEKELKLLKEKIQETGAKKVLIYTINDGKNTVEPWKGVDKSVLQGTGCKELKVVEIPDQLVKEWCEVLTAMAA